MRSKEWVSWADFLGNNNVSTHFKEYVSYEEAKEFAKKNKIFYGTQWNKQKSTFPINIPRNPQTVYKENGWIDWPSFFDRKKIDFVSFEESKKILKKYNFVSERELKDFKAKYKNTELDKVPKSPKSVYKEWKGWNDFLSTSWQEKGLKQKKNNIKKKYLKRN